MRVDDESAIVIHQTTKRGQVMKQNRRLFALVFLALLLPVAASAQTSGAPAPDPAVKDPKSMDQVAKQLNNPVADLWALNFQFNRYYLQGDATERTREQDVLNFQPVLPIHLTNEWNLITRPVIPFVFNQPEFEPGKGWDETSGLGGFQDDINLRPHHGHEQIGDNSTSENIRADILLTEGVNQNGDGYGRYECHVAKPAENPEPLRFHKGSKPCRRDSRHGQADCGNQEKPVAADGVGGVNKNRG
jgi:hypothetical protein